MSPENNDSMTHLSDFPKCIKNPNVACGIHHDIMLPHPWCLIMCEALLAPVTMQFFSFVSGCPVAEGSQNISGAGVRIMNPFPNS